MSNMICTYPGFTGSIQPQQEGNLPSDTPSESILSGESAVIRRLRSQIEHIAPYYRTALIHGEPGAGKRSVAHAIHALSPGVHRPFIVADSAALAASIANDNNPTALLESAHGGTLYLESVGELQDTQQSSLVRFLRAWEERRNTTSPSIHPRPSDMRILAASSRDLRTLASIGTFRQDLYACLSVVEVLVPPLRQRIDDLPHLAAWFLRRLANRTGQPHMVLSPAALTQLQERPWPNNLRELNTVLTQAAALAEANLIEPRHLLALVPLASSVSTPPVRIDRLDVIIHRHVLDVLTRCNGNKLRAAELLGISRSTLYRMLDTTTPNPLPE